MGKITYYPTKEEAIAYAKTTGTICNVGECNNILPDDTRGPNQWSCWEGHKDLELLKDFLEESWPGCLKDGSQLIIEPTKRPSAIQNWERKLESLKANRHTDDAMPGDDRVIETIERMLADFKLETCNNS